MRAFFLKITKKKHAFLLFDTFCCFIIVSCSSPGTPAVAPNQITDKQIQQMEDKMFANDKPQNHYEDIRQYVFDQYPDLPSDVEALLKNTAPKFVENDTRMEYCFFWVLPDGSILEVVTTPPPLCDPIAVHHGKHVSYE